MVTAVCIAGENPDLDLAQSYSMHQSCSGMAMGEEGPEPCECFHHGMPVTRAPRRVSLRAKARLILAAGLVLLLLWAWLR